MLVCLFYLVILTSQWTVMASSELELDHHLTVSHGRHEGLLSLPFQHENTTKPG